MEQLFVNLEKDRYPNKKSVRTILSRRHPDLDIQAILDGGDRWITRLVAADDDMPSKLEDSLDGDLPLLPDEEGDSEDAPKDEEEPKDEKKDEKEDKKDDKPKADKSDSDVAGQIKGVIGELTTLFGDLGGKVDDLQSAHDAKSDKLKDIGDVVGEDAGMPMDGPGPKESPMDIGPVPGGPDVSGGPMGDMAGPPPVPTGPHPPKGFDKRKKPSVGVPTFTNSKIVSVPIFKEDGEKVTVARALQRISSDDRYESYEVSGIQTDEDHDRYIAHLILKDK